MTNTRPPTKSEVRSRWTANDEATLQELVERKQRILEANREPVVALMETITYATDSGVVVWLVDWLIANADSVRDVLEPFDSGMRGGGS